MASAPRTVAFTALPLCVQMSAVGLPFGVMVDEPVVFELPCHDFFSVLVTAFLLCM